MDPVSTMPISSNDQTADSYYAQFWASGDWAGVEPNGDECARLKTIRELVESIWNPNREPFRILDIGCGRGWLTHALTRYGRVCGLEVVPEALVIAKKLFPNLEFKLVDTTQLTESDAVDLGASDLAVSSEVIEHVPRAIQAKYLHGIGKLLKTGGHLVITTPRGELWSNWNARTTDKQPTEDWVTEDQLDLLAKSAGFELLVRRRICLPGSDYHWSAKMSQSRIGFHLLRLMPPLRKWANECNAIYQAALFRKE